MVTRAGKLDCKMRRYSRETTRDAMGGAIEDLVHKDWFWAHIKPLSGTERMTAKQLESGVTHLIRTRHVEGISPKDVLEYDGRTFEIDAAINVDERSREMELMCKEAVTNA